MLEDRYLPSILTVTTAADNATMPTPGSLRAVLAAAANGDTINFAPALAGQTIALQGSMFPTLVVTKNVTITSNGVPGIVISGSNAATDFTVSSGVRATIDSLTISNGLSQPSGPNGASLGGGILNEGTLTISNCTIANNRAAGGSSDGGGGIANLGTLTVVNSTIAFNTLGPSASASGNAGAGIYSTGTLTLSSCTISDNSALPGNGNGGGLDLHGTTSLVNSILSGNLGITANNASGTPITSAFNDVLEDNYADFLTPIFNPNDPNNQYGPPAYTTGPSSPPAYITGSNNLVGISAMLDTSLKNNGGPTPTLAELVGSPSIANGNSLFLTNQPFAGPPFFDQRGPGFVRVLNDRMDIGAFQVQSFPAYLNPASYFASGTDAGVASTVAIYESAGPPLASFNPFPGASFTGGVRVAIGDVNGDGVPDLIVGSGPGGIGLVEVFDGASLLADPIILGRKLLYTPTPIAAFFPYGNAFTGGVFVAAGNLDGGASDDIITGADSGGGPQVNIYSAAQIRANDFARPAMAFYAYPPSFRGGVRVEAGDVNGDGKADLITAPGPGGGPQINIYFGRAGGDFITDPGQAVPMPDLSFFAFGPTLANYTGGIYVTAVPDVIGNGQVDLFCGAGTDSCEVTLFTGAQLTGPAPDLNPLTAFLAPTQEYGFAPSFTTGVRLGASVAELGNGSQAGPVLLTTSGPGSGPYVEEFNLQAILDNLGVQPSPFMYLLMPGGDISSGAFVSG
jgi:hypothetical protein